MSQTPASAFVLMPFSPEFDQIYERLVEPALREAGFVARRADSLLDQQNVLRDIVQGIGRADLVVAELTSLNPNVLYEVGLAHGLRIPTVLLAQSIDDVPFDLRSYRIQIYSTRFDEVDKLRSGLKAIAVEHRDGHVTFGSPVTDFLVAVRDDHQNHFPEDRDESPDAATPGLLDQLAELEDSAEQLEQIGARLAQATEDLTEDMERHGERMGALGADQSPGSLAQMRRTAAMAASDLVRYANRLEADLPTLTSAVESLINSGADWIGQLPASTDEEASELRAAGVSMEGLAAAVDEGLIGLREMRGSLSEVTGMSRDLDRSVRRVAGDLGKLIVLLERSEAFARRMASVVEEKLAESQPEEGG